MTSTEFFDALKKKQNDYRIGTLVKLKTTYGNIPIGTFGAITGTLCVNNGIRHINLTKSTLSSYCTVNVVFSLSNNTYVASVSVNVLEPVKSAGCLESSGTMSKEGIKAAQEEAQKQVDKYNEMVTFMEENKLDVFDPELFKAYKILETVKTKGSTTLNQAKSIIELLKSNA